MTTLNTPDALYGLLNRPELDDAAAREVMSILASYLAVRIRAKLEQLPDQQILLLPILRGGLLMYPAFINIFRNAAVGLIQVVRQGAHRSVIFESLPCNISPDVILLLDPVASTGRTLACVSQLVRSRYGKARHNACLVAAARGATAFLQESGIDLDGISTDEEDIKGLVVPDLGARDAGDLACNPAQDKSSCFDFPIADFEQLHATDDRVAALRRELIYEPVLQVVRSHNFNKALDLGCGGGNLTKSLSNFVSSVVGYDPSEEAIALAKETNNTPNIEFTCQPPDLTPARFDLVVCCMVLNSTPAFEDLIQMAVRCSSPVAMQVWVFLHPAFQFNESQWRARKGVTASYPSVSYSLLPSYFEEHLFEKQIWGVTLTEHHRSLSRYINALMASGLHLVEMKEPRASEPDASLVDHLTPRVAVLTTCTRPMINILFP